MLRLSTTADQPDEVEAGECVGPRERSWLTSCASNDGEGVRRDRSRSPYGKLARMIAWLPSLKSARKVIWPCLLWLRVWVGEPGTFSRM